MKVLMLIAITLMVSTMSPDTRAAYIEKANVANTKDILDTKIGRTEDTIKVSLDESGERLVVLLNNTNGRYILDLERILSPGVRVASRTSYKNDANGNLITVTKMYFPYIDESTMNTRINILSQAVRTGKLGYIHVR